MNYRKVKLTIAFDGTHYAGWQRQKSGIAVQQKIEEALAKLFPGAKALHGSSRTDAGVHAQAMIAHVEVPAAELRMTPSKLVLAMNAHLPADIRVMRAARCRADFHARFQAKGKQYRYYVWNHPAMNPLQRQQAWHVARALDLASMRSAAKRFIGKKDFKSFAANRNYEMESTVRTLTHCEIRKQGPLLTFLIRGDGFLYKMCRGIVGTLVQVGLGKFGVQDIQTMLECRNRSAAGMSAPAHGLVLWKVYYR